MRIGNRGQALVEYILIIALVSASVIALVNIFGGVLKDKITEATCSMVGETYIPGDKKGEGYCSSEEIK